MALEQYTAFPIKYGKVKKAVANNMESGSTLTEKLIDCIASQPEGAVIEAYEGDPLISSIELKKNQTLFLNDGEWKFNQGKKFIMGDGSNIDGNNQNATIWQPFYAYTDTNVGYQVIVGKGGTQVAPSGQNFAMPSFNLTVRGVRFQGLHNTQFANASNTVGFYNTHNGLVENCYFKDTCGYAAEFGITANALENADRDTKNFAMNCRFTQNVVENCATQNFAAINGENLRVDHNTFLNPGFAAYPIVSIVPVGSTHVEITFADDHNASDGTAIAIQNLTGGSWTSLNTPYGFEGQWTTVAGNRKKIRVAFNASGFGTAGLAKARVQFHINNGTVIDFEPADVGERFANCDISYNLIDARDISGIFGGIGIPVPASAMYSKGISVTNNRILGAETGGGWISIGIGTHYHGGSPGVSPNRNFRIADNYIQGTVGFGMELSGKMMEIESNRIIDCGRGGNAQVRLINVTDSTFARNKITYSPGNSTNRYEVIEEEGVNTGNDYIGNTLGGKGSALGSPLWQHLAGSTVTYGLYKDNIFIGSDNAGCFYEGNNSNHNTFQGNHSGHLPNGNAGVAGLRLVGANNKVLSHHYSDGASMFGAAAAKTITGAYTLTRMDNGAVIQYAGGSDVTVTIPAGLGAGFNCAFVQTGAGAIVITPASGVTRTHRSSHTKSAGNPSQISIFATAANAFVLSGDTA